MRRFSLGFVPGLLMLLPAAVLAAENFPPPEFSQPYPFPVVTTPDPRSAALTYVDIVVLLVTLSLAAYTILRKRSRRDTVILVIFSLLYFGFFRRGCICSIGAIQNVALAIWNPDYSLPLVAAAFFLLPIVFALFFGRVFCGAVCPLGAAQELVLLRPLKVPAWLDKGLGVIPFVYLGAAVLFAATNSAFIICRYDPFVLFFRLSGTTAMLIFGVAMLLLSMVVGRPYCRYLCPYGALLRMVSVFAGHSGKITLGECINCHLCADACPYGAIRPPTTFGPPASRTEGKQRLITLLLLLPVMIGAAGWATRLGSPVLARVHPIVRLADRVWLEENARVEGQTEASEAFESHGVPSMELYQQAAGIRKQFDKGSWILGGWIGLVFGLRMIAFSIRRRREDYEIDPAACVDCTRCYESCPVEHDRLHTLATKQMEDRQ